MSITAPTPAPAPVPDEDDDTPTRTPWQRWALAIALGSPVAAAYGLVVMLLGRAFFLDAEQERALRAAVDDVGPLTLLWLVATSTCLVGAVFTMHEVLEHRAARRSGRVPLSGTRRPPSWAWPIVLTGSPVVAVALAALVTILAGALRDVEPGASAVLFAALAGGWLMLIVAIGWLLLVMRTRTEDGEPRRMEGIEDRWLQQAAAKSYWDVLTLVGVGCLAFSVWRVDLDPSLVLLGIALVATLDLPVRLWLLRRAEERA